MWCQNCGQDVPAVYSADLSAYCCGRCMRMLPNMATSPPQEGVSSVDSSRPASVDSSAQGRTYDEWSVEQDLWHLNRELKTWPSRLPTKEHSSKRTDPLEDSRKAGGDVSSSSVQQESAPSAGQSLEWNWGILAFGMMASLCGSTLSGWAMFSHEADLWNVGFPILAGGASSVLVGVLLQLERVGHQPRP